MAQICDNGPNIQRESKASGPSYFRKKLEVDISKYPK